MTRDNDTSSEWTIGFTDQATGQGGTLTVFTGLTSWTDVNGGVIETAATGTQCSQTPPSGNAAFTNISVSSAAGHLTPSFGNIAKDATNTSCAASASSTPTSTNLLWMTIDPGSPVLPMRQVVEAASMLETHDSLLVVDQNNDLWMYPGSYALMTAPDKAYKILDHASFANTQMFGPGDLDGDGKADLMGVDSSGDLWMWKGDGGLVGAKTKIGYGFTTGWQLVPAGDLNGDNKIDLLAVDPNGDLYFYKGLGNASFASRVKVGNAFTAGWKLYSAGDQNGDGYADIFSTDSKGILYMYLGKGDGTFGTRTQIGNGFVSGWRLTSGWDLNGDHKTDLLSVDSTGKVYFYAGQGNGTFLPRAQYTQNW